MNKIGTMILEELNLKVDEPFYFRNQKFIFKEESDKLELFTYSNFGVITDPKNVSDILNNSNEIIRGEYPVLTENEKEYLINVVKPFIEKIVFIKREDIIAYPDLGCDASRIVIMYEDIVSGTCNMYLPHFKKNSAFIGLKNDINYTLKELGVIVNASAK